ncbi:MAG: hypothetical protein KAS49_02980 [Candidatus Cloacimonetes bacterium]|nr:hypothetical protein [Candidatus Cloacimonadota bacterium]
MKKKKNKRKIPPPFYKKKIFWTIIPIIISVFFGVMELGKKQNDISIGNSETIIKDNAKVIEYNVEGDVILGNQYEIKDNIYNETQNSTISEPEYGNEVCEELKKKHQNLINDLKNVKDESAKLVINEELKKLEKEIETKCEQ